MDRELASAAAFQAMDRDYAGSAIGYAETRVTNSTLGEIRERIERAAKVANEVAYKLNEHADRLHGAVPQAVGNANEKNLPHGAISELFAALDRLDAAHSFLAEQAGRNCNIA